MCNKMFSSVFRFDCSKINAKTDISNNKSKLLQKVEFWDCLNIQIHNLIKISIYV